MFNTLAPDLDGHAPESAPALALSRRLTAVLSHFRALPRRNRNRLRLPSPLLLILALVSALQSFLPGAAAQSMASANYGMRAMATAQLSPPKITLTWYADLSNAWEYTPKYSVYRRNPTDANWPSTALLYRQSLTPVNGKVSFDDTSVAPNTRYEYRIMVEDPTRPGSHVGYGYVLAGINIDEVEDHGTALLVVDQTIASAISSKLDQLKSDLIGDGWRVARIDVARHDSAQLSRAQTVKTAIKNKYQEAGVNLRAVILIGHVPIPYSGVIAPDGHRYPNGQNDVNDNHIGAWAADVYYADMTGTWTDTTANYTNTKSDPAASARLSNHPSDHKFDQDTIPGNGSAALQVGRIDFADLPVAGVSETALLSAYLDREHAFRHRSGAMDVRRKALISDSNDPRGHDAYAAAGYRSFTPILKNGGADLEMASSEPTAADSERWINKATGNTFLFTYAFGAGSNESIAGQGDSTTDPGGYRNLFSSTLIARDPKVVFYMLFGSWFGDWDHTNNLMRTTLATDYGLACMWAARPQITLHQMGLGETIGAAVQAAQNNTGAHRSMVDPTTASAFRSVHIALLGDPTLRAHPVKPVTGAHRTNVGSDVQLSWSPSTDEDIVGYNVYRASVADGPYTPAPNGFVTGASYTDVGQAAAGYHYLVRAVKLETSGSGKYYNLSQGVFLAPGGSSQVGTPTFSPAGGTYSSTQSVTMGTNPSDATIRYTTDGSTPTPTTGTVYSGPVSVASSMTLKAIAYKSGMTDSSVATANYTIQTGGQSVVSVTAPDSSATVASDTDLAQWKFTRTNPAAALTVYFQFSGTAAQWTDYRRMTLGDLPEQVSFAAGQSEVTWNIRAWGNSNNVNPHYAILTLSPNSNYAIGTPGSAQINFTATGGGTAPTPAFSPAGGTYSSAQSVTISASGASIRYTTDGSTPTSSSGTIYSAPITVSSSTTLKAIAYQSGLADSSVATASYTIGGGQSVVTVTAPDSSATVASDTDLAQWKFTRTNAAAALTIYFQFSGTAAQWTDYRRMNLGDLPEQLTFAAGQSEVTWDIRAWGNSNNVNPHNAILTLSPNSNYTIGTANSAQINFTSGGQSVVTISAPDAWATVASDTDLAQWRFTRTNATAALTVYFQFSGTAAQWTDYRRMTLGDLPEQVTFAAGQTEVTWNIRAWGNSNSVNPHYAICTLSPDTGYTVGAQNSAQINFSP